MEIAYLRAIANGKFADAAQMRLHHAGLEEDKTFVKSAEKGGGKDGEVGYDAIEATFRSCFRDDLRTGSAALLGWPSTLSLRLMRLFARAV